MNAKKSRLVSLLLVLSISLALVAQWYFAKKRDFIWDGIALYTIAMLVFSRIIARVEGREWEPGGRDFPSLGRGLWQALGCSVVRLAVLVAGIVLVMYVTSASGSLPAGKPFYGLLSLWAFGILISAAAFVDWRSMPRRLRQVWLRLGAHGPETVLVVTIVVGTFLSRAINLDTVPRLLSGDEANMGLEAISVLEGRLKSPFVTGWLSHSTLYFFMQAAFLRLFGVTTSALRLPSALASGGIALLLYGFTRRFFGRWVAILAALFFAVYHYAIHFGRMALNNIWDPFFAVGTFYLLSVGLEKKRLLYMLASGVLMGLAIYFYMGSRLIPIILVVYLLHWSLSERGFLRDNAVYLVIFCLMAFLVAAPMLAFFRAHPSNLMARWDWVGIFPSGWVDAEVQRTGKTVLAVVLGQFLKASLAFNYFWDPSFHYRPNIPLLRFLSSVLFVFGMTYAVSQWRKRGYFLLAVWFLLVIIFGGALLENPPLSPRLVLAIPPVVICVALGLVKISSYIQTAFNARHGVAVALSLALVLLVSYQSLHFYFGVYTPTGEFAGHNTEVADRMGKYLRILGPEYQCYFFGPPRIYYGHATIPFLARGITGVDVLNPIRDNVDFVNPRRDAVFVFLPERRAEFDVVHHFYPAGLLREFRDRKGHLLFIAYEVDV